MSVQVDRQTQVDLFSVGKGYQFTHQGKIHHLSTVEKVHEFFENSCDTVKLCQNGKKSYRHFVDGEVQIFGSKMALRKSLSQESGGRWIEKKSDRKDYMVDNSGVLCTSFKKVSREECTQKLETSSTLQKVLGMGLGILALTPGLSEVARRIPIGAKEIAMGLIAINQKSPALGALSCSLMSSRADAQAVGTEFQVNTYTTGSQCDPNVVAMNDGGFLVTWWSSDRYGPDINGIAGQRYHVNGSRLGNELEINNFTMGSGEYPTASALKDGGFVVTWIGIGDRNIYGRSYSTNGVAIDSEFQVNNYTADVQLFPVVETLNDGSFIVAWNSRRQDPDGSAGVYGQRFYPNSTKFDGEFRINTYIPARQSYPSISVLISGEFVIVWESAQDGDGEGIFGQRYFSNATKRGPEFQVSNHTIGDQQSASVAGLNDGGFVVTWESEDQDGSLFGIFAQRFDVNGSKVGDEFQVNTYTLDSQFSPSIAGLKDGGFVILWDSDGQIDSRDVFGQRFDSNGAPISGEFQVNNYTIASQSRPSVTELDDGGFVVAWASGNQDGDARGIYAKRYDANGTAVVPPPMPTPTPSPSSTPTPTLSPSPTSSSTPVLSPSPSQSLTPSSSLGSSSTVSATLSPSMTPIPTPSLFVGPLIEPCGNEFQINTYTAGSQQGQKVAALANGGYVLVWFSNGQDGDSWGIFGRRYGSQGNPIGLDFQVNTYTADSQRWPSVAALTNGGFVATWNSFGQDGDRDGIYAKRFDANGAVDGTEFQVSNYTASSQDYPDVGGLADGGFVIAWVSDDQDGDENGIFAQRFASDGGAIGTEFQVNTYTFSSQLSPRIAPLSSGGYVIIWQSDGQDGDLTGIFGKRYNSDGVLVGSEFQVNSYATNSQENPAIAPLNDGGFVVVWQSAGQDGDNLGVYGQRFNANGVRRGAEFQVNTNTVGRQNSPSLTTLNDGGFMVTWEGPDQDREGIFGQRFDNIGLKLGSEIQVNTVTDRRERSPSVAALSDGGFVTTWTGGDVDLEGVFGQRYCAFFPTSTPTLMPQTSSVPSPNLSSTLSPSLMPILTPSMSSSTSEVPSARSSSEAETPTDPSARSSSEAETPTADGQAPAPSPEIADGVSTKVLANMIPIILN